MTKPPPSRDWDKEMAEIDRLMAKGPAPAPSSPTPAARPSGGERPAVRPVPAQPTGGRLGVWARVALGAALVGAMTQWPYASCGLMLYLYLGATAVVGLAGLWGMIASWKRRMPLAHVISIGIALWGALLAGRVIVDRSDYARVPRSWGCTGEQGIP